MTTPVTKNPKIVERGEKAYETHLRKIKEGILYSSESTPISGDLTPSSTPSSTPLTTTATNTSIPLTTTNTHSTPRLFLHQQKAGTDKTSTVEQAPQPKKHAAFFHMK